MGRWGGDLGGVMWVLGRLGGGLIWEAGGVGGPWRGLGGLGGGECSWEWRKEFGGGTGGLGELMGI